MSASLSDRKILVLVANGVEEGVMSSVQRELIKTGATVKTVGTESGLVNSWNKDAGPMGAWGLYFPVDQQIGQTLGADFDALIVPAGTRAIQKLSTNPHAERIIMSFIMAQKPMVFMGDAVELLAMTKLAKDWNVGGPDRSEQTMIAAGANWQGSSETIHNTLMTGDMNDMAGFITRMIAHLGGKVEMKAAA